MLELFQYLKLNMLNDTLLILYLIALITDAITGNLVALNQKRWTSKTGINGTVKHLSLLTVILLFVPTVSYVLNIDGFQHGILIYVVTQYTISIIENLDALGIHLGHGFTKYFDYLQSFDGQNTKKQDNKESRGLDE